MTSNNGKGAATAAPATPEEAERQLDAAVTPEEAWRIYELCADREENWRVIRLKAERRHGELLGPPMTRQETGGVTGCNTSGADRVAQTRARKVAAIPEEKFNEYIREHGPKSSREGLLREHGTSNGKRPKEPKVQRVSSAQAVDMLRNRVREMQQDKWGHWPRWSDQDREIARAVLAAKKQKSPTGKRLHTIGLKRSAARAGGDPTVLWDTAYEIMKLTSLLESLDIEDVELDEHSLDTINELHDDMIRLQEWIDRTMGAVQGRLGEWAIRRKIIGLRSKTVENGCSAGEAHSAQQAADRLERKLKARLIA